MAIFRCLQRIIRNPNPNSPSKTIPLFSRNPFLSPPSSSPHSRFLSPLSDVITSFHGPLFISSTTPWNLLQSATPLLVQSDVVFPSRRVKASELLENAKLGFPVTLRFQDERRENAKLGFPTELGFQENRKRESGVQSSKRNDGGGLVRDFVNLPNFVSFSRLVSGPVLGWMIVNEWYLPAFVGLAVSGATDWLDGYLARRMGINSVVGSYLDPLADKVLIGCVAVAMVENNLLHPGLVGLVVLRDVMLIGGAVYKRASSLHWHWKSWYDFFNLDGTRPEKVEPLFISKVNTVFQLILIAAALLQPELGTPETQLYVTYLSWLVASTTVASTAAYGVKHLSNRPISIGRTR